MDRPRFVITSVDGHNLLNNFRKNSFGFESDRFFNESHQRHQEFKDSFDQNFKVSVEQSSHIMGFSIVAFFIFIFVICVFPICLCAICCGICNRRQRRGQTIITPAPPLANSSNYFSFLSAWFHSFLLHLFSCLLFDVHLNSLGNVWRMTSFW